MESGNFGDDLIFVISICCSVEIIILRFRRYGSYFFMNVRKWEVGRERCYYVIMYF